MSCQNNIYFFLWYKNIVFIVNTKKARKQQFPRWRRRALLRKRYLLHWNPALKFYGWPVNRCLLIKPKTENTWPYILYIERYICYPLLSCHTLFYFWQNCFINHLTQWTHPCVLSKDIEGTGTCWCIMIHQSVTEQNVR